MNQVESQEIVGFAGHDHILGVESSGYWLADALDVGQRPQNGRRYVFRLVGACGSASLWTSCLSGKVARVLVALKHFVEVVFQPPGLQVCFRGYETLAHDLSRIASHLRSYPVPKPPQ